MKLNYKTAFLSIAIPLALFILLCTIFNYRIATGPSDGYDFSPGTIHQDFSLSESSVRPKNVIFFIADGMGFTHLSLDLMLNQSEDQPIIWHQFDVKGWQDARSNYGPMTDSGASATALATGQSTFFETIGMDQEGNILPNLFEIAQQKEYNTGIVTDSYIWDATPAAFVAHTKSRDNAEDILNQIAGSDLDLIFGELEDLGEDGIPELQPTLNILQKRFMLLDESLDFSKDSTGFAPIAAIFKEDQVQDLNSSPNLTSLTEVALDYLSFQGKPFMLLVECEEMDAASHANNPGRVVRGLQSLQKTLRLVLDFADQNGETLLVFTSDHETGGIAANIDFKNYPKVQIAWTSRDHTAAVVPFFAKGPGADQFASVHRNWQIGRQLINLLEE